MIWLVPDDHIIWLEAYIKKLFDEEDDAVFQGFTAKAMSAYRKYK